MACLTGVGVASQRFENWWENANPDMNGVQR